MTDTNLTHAHIDGDVTRPRGINTVFQPHTSVTVVEGSTFCVSETNADISPHNSDGLFVHDTRVISKWHLRVDGKEVEPLGFIPAEPYDCLFVGRLPARPGYIEPTLIVERHRMVGMGMREDITIRNQGAEAAGLDISLAVESDFADLFEVKERRYQRLLQVDSEAGQHELVLTLRSGASQRRTVRVKANGATAVPGALLFQVVVPPRGSWEVSVQVSTSVEGSELQTSFPLDHPLDSARPALRMKDWRQHAASVTVANSVLADAVRTSLRDLGALRIWDADHPDDDVVAAGAPWFMALFGRDSLLTSAMLMPFAPRLAMGTLRTLARLQGRAENPMSEEQPGRILHEVRLGTDASLALGGEKVYYGSIDSTPLFVMLVGMALRAGASTEELQGLKPAVDAAVAWIGKYGDFDGDGFVEYQRSSDRGLLNQGWKDSADSMVHRDGTLASPPIALAEVQGYTYAALLAAADLEQALTGDSARADELRARAATLKARFHEAFWMEDEGFYALGLDARKRPMKSITSNIGHCLWTGIVDDGVADRVVARLSAPDMFTGFGIRTLSSHSLRYNPASYHDGSVWPHDTIIGASGMAKYGHKDAAMQVVSGLLDALEAFDGRLPELFCGFGRDDKAVPIPYPTSCSPQAWAAAVPFEMLRIALGLEADLTRNTVHVEPVPALIGSVAMSSSPLGADEVTLLANTQEVTLVGVPEHVHVKGARVVDPAQA
ncbi:amylo-alpha-1,6-glucosidase [Tessaracoccus sp. OS52]|uniref:amylo-alpha-1,6-glucosidase n=1 Tax=Tessaracoccus sp. OS52 TaxID=2886691 RepID=UPI001D109A5A|nr:glycogen debranching N-terminal domain-containing protein [Tessaracoccus sp. OS52]MCC2592933.1 amylo-alpha-1,6-glucosidase [Tessaracoccus sp. OS52]